MQQKKLTFQDLFMKKRWKEQPFLMKYDWPDLWLGVGSLCPTPEVTQKVHRVATSLLPTHSHVDAAAASTDKKRLEKTLCQIFYKT